MNRILILTKNLSVETYLQQQLQKLNYEVFVSSSIWERWENSGKIDPFLKSFQWVLLSETLSDAEVKELGIQFRTNCLVRIVDEEPSEAIVSEWLDYHIFDWILANASLERIREKLLHKTLLNQVEYGIEQTAQEGDSRPLLSYSKKPFPLYYSDIHFTKIERGIINQLMMAKNLSLGREELCESWRSSNKNSKLSQLSSSVAKIRKKVEEAYGIEDAVITLWGEGYQLNAYFHRCLLKGEFQKDRHKLSL